MQEAELTGDRRWREALDRKLKACNDASWRATREGLRYLERKLKLKLRTHTHPEGTPTTSPPGDPPALVTGTLMRSVKPRGPYRGRHEYEVRGQVGPTARYARIQELGGRTGKSFGTGDPVTLPARPYVRPTVEEARRDVRRIYVVRWTEALMS